MNPLRHVSILARTLRLQAARRILSHRIQYRHPTLLCDPTVIWDYGYRDLDTIELGQHVVVRAFAEILVYRHTRFSSAEGRLIVGDRVIISAGANIRAAGGTIRIGAGSGIGQHTTLAAAGHTVAPGVSYFDSPWDKSRTGITVGANVFVGAHCVLLPGVSVGDNAVVAAGSVVTRDIPANEIWGGVPARRIKAVGEGRATT